VNFLLKDRYQDGFELDYAKNVSDAQYFLSKNGVDMILLDDRLSGGITSEDSIPMLQKSAFHVPIIVVTKDPDGRHLQDRVRLGTNKVGDKFELKKELANGLLD
jgi:response regulator of citrate/malate metabolism